MFIYKITHKSTHQCYIGQAQHVIERWKQHLSSQDLPIQKAISQEGIVNFTFEVLEDCDPTIADDRETYWINYYHSVAEGYNTTQGNGTLTPNYRQNVSITKEDHRNRINSPDGVDAYDPKTGAFVKHYDSIADANRALGHEGTGNISAVCRGRGRTAYGFIWKYTTPQN